MLLLIQKIKIKEIKTQILLDKTLIKEISEAGLDSTDIGKINEAEAISVVLVIFEEIFKIGAFRTEVFRIEVFRIGAFLDRLEIKDNRDFILIFCLASIAIFAIKKVIECHIVLVPKSSRISDLVKIKIRIKLHQIQISL